MRRSPEALSSTHISSHLPTLRRPARRRQSQMNSRKLGPSPADLQNHLYTSFLEGSTADVALRVHGSWDAIYKLHRVVLIQSGFFRSLFTAGFAESTPRIGSGTGPDEIVIRFDDPNITRAAFEICLARLYGGGPPLDIDPSLIPTLSKPLTPSFPHEPPLHKVPADHHPATPRFLLSLLATTVYLSIPFLASQALSSILSTVGPHTVLNYLNFALGGHTGLLDRDSGEPEAAVGLESVAQIIEYEPSMLDVSSIRDNSVLEHHIKEDPADLQASTSSMSYDYSEDYETEGATKSPSYHYGALSDKIGEACACWLARWGADILSLEEKQMDAASHEERNASFTRRRSKTVPSGSTSNTATERQEEFHVPVIWSRGGLNARWVSAVISADTFFIRGERERYDFARRVIELRRKRGIVPTEEEEWINLFKQGIYYANMSMDDIIYVSQDVSPTTKKVFVPLSTIQAAHWMQSILRHQITARPVSHRQPSVSAPSALPREKELGVTQTTADILMTATTSADDSKTLYQVPVNSSVRIGDNGNDYNGTLEGGTLSMDQLFFSSPSLSPPPSSPTLKPNPVTAPQVTPVTEKDFFGLHPPVFTTSSAIASDSRGKFQWSTYPPYRFAVEFWDLESLKEKSRLYSRTIWYAGSLFNTYIQVVRKKGQVQLGIYLHRQSSIEPIPPSSAPSPSTTSTPSEALPSLDNAVVVTHNRGPSLPSLFPPLTHTTSHYSPSIYPSSRSMSPRSSGRLSTSPSSSPSSSLPTSLSASTTTSTSSTPTPQLPATAAPVTPPQPYRDPRASISAYFVISCASATGSSQTRFSSSPDVFSVGQSWGWKSSSLRTEEFMDVQVDGSTSNSETSPNKDSSLRATIVLGLV